MAQRIKEELNYCDVSHLYVDTYGICQEVSPRNGIKACIVAPTAQCLKV